MLPTKKKRLFGTDGIRSVAGTPPLDLVTVARLGSALVRALKKSSPKFLLGRDTRESGIWLERELVRGARLAGAHCVSVGILPTPAVALLTYERSFDAGIVISASHNPYQDNGIKIFSSNGEKFDTEFEARVEAIMDDTSWEVEDVVCEAIDMDDWVDVYRSHISRVLPDPRMFASARIAVDCANGATASFAPRMFRELGFDVLELGCEPDGRNINLNCGSTNPESLVDAVLVSKCRLGIAFDGDGDRAIFVDHLGRIVDGDGILLICARHLAETGRLRGNAVVATVMSNMGLELALREHGIELFRSQVGDRYVTKALKERNLVLGGEQSGHVIFRDILSTGDGLLTALAVLDAMSHFELELATLVDDFTVVPQVLLNVPVNERRELFSAPDLLAVITDVEGRLGDSGRLLVRYSGTEPVLRIMIEGTNIEEIRVWADEIADVARAILG